MSQDIWAEIEQEDTARRSRGAALMAPTVPPDTMSEAVRIAGRRGVPAGAVLGDLPRYKQLDELDAIQTASTAQPALGSWLIDPTNVALSKDELPQVSKLADSIAKTKATQDRPYDWGPWGWGQLAADIGGSFVSQFGATFGRGLEGQADLRGATHRTLDRLTRRVGGEAIGDFMADPFNQRGGQGVDLSDDALRTSGEAIQSRFAFDPRQQSTATDVAGGLGTLGAQITTFAATRGAGSTPLNLGLGANQAADMAREAGAEGTEGADAAVLASAPVAAVLERVGLDRLLNRAPPGIKNAMGRWLTDKFIAAGIEGGQEATEQFTYNLLAQQLYNPDQSLTKGLRENFEVGGLVGGIARTLTGARYARTQAEREGELLDDITLSASAVALRERNPEKFRELAQKLAASGADRVYLDGAEAATYFQSAGLDPAQFMDADALTDAAVAGTDVAVPMEDWVTRIAPEHGKALSKFARLTPSGMSRADLDQFNERAEVEFQAFLDAVPRETNTVDTSQEVYDDVLGQLLGTGMNRQAAEANAELHRRFWQTQAQRSGKSAIELYQPYGLRIQREDPAGMAILRERPNADAAVDSLLGRLVSGDIPTEMQAMGPSLVEWLSGQGGVQDEAMAGELRRLNESDRVNRRGQPKLVRRGGRTLDQARELAVEAGYLPEGADLNALLDALTNEVNTGKTVRVGGDQVLADQRNMLLEAGDLLNEAGVDPADREAARRFLVGDTETRFYQDALPEQDEVTALKARIAALEQELRTDELTGLRNRRAFNEDEALGWEGVMAFDMDGLTALNAMGHEVGDAALKAIGEVMLASETPTARFYHTSGDEFYGRATTMAEAQELAQMIQDKLESVDLDIVMSGSGGETRDFTYRGIGVSRGAGATPNEADQIAIQNKAEREASGVRQAKGDPGPLRRLIDRRAEGNRDRRQRVDPQQEGNAEAAEDGLTEFNQDDASESIRRGWINFADRAAVQIGLTPKADLSTFIHESGHLFLEVMGDLARDPYAPQDIVDDYAAIVRFLGVSSREEIGREQHEKLARAFESFLGEGKAPVPELAGVMTRMRAWMIQVYKTLRALDVELNDEIRGVFDRMLVGDAAVSRAEDAANMEPLFREAATAGMSPARFREYLKQQQAGHDAAQARIAAQAVREVQREQEAWWKAARAEMLEEVKAETYALPVYQAWANLARGTQPDDSPLPDGMARMKIDRDWLVKRYGQQYVNENLRFKRVYAAQGTDGDVVAGQFGFPTGDSMVTALINAPPMQAYIQATTDARMAEKYGDMRSDPLLAEKAMQIVHNDRRMAAITGDVAVLEGLVGAPALDRKSVKAWAQGKIAGTQLRDVVPFIYLRSERKHAREAQRLTAAGDYAGALVEARQRLANAMLYDEASKAKDMAERVDKRLTKLAKKSSQTRLAKAGGDWLQLTNSILAALGRYDFGPNRGPINMSQWIDKHVEAENENPIPESVEVLVDSQQTTDLQRLTIAQIRDVRTAVMNIDTQAAAVAKVMANDKAVEWGTARDSLTARLEETQGAGTTAFTEAEKSTADRIMDGIKGFADVLLSPQTIIERLDGGEQGPWHDLFWNIGARSRDARDAMREATLKPLFDMMEGWDKAKRQRIMLDTVKMESMGGVELKRQTLISMALNMGTDSSLKKLMGGGRWVNGQHMAFDQSVIDEVVGKLTREDWDIVQKVWEASASLKKPTEELQKRLGGIIPRDLATRTIDTPFGSIQGQYFPLIGDPTQSSVGEKQQASATVQQIIGPTARATTSKSRLQERTGVMYPLELNLESLLLGRVDEVITDITHREFLLQANKILNDGRLRNLLRTRTGDTAYESLRGAVARAVGDRIYGDPAMRYPNKLMDAATTNLSVMALGFRYLLGVGNYAAAWPQAVSRVGVKHLVSAFSRTLGPGQFQAAQTFVYRLSPYMARRNGDFDRQLQQSLRTMAGKQTLRRTVARFAMSYQQTADRLAVVPIWMARFEQAVAAGEPQESAVRLADTAIQQTQTDHSAIGLSAFEGDRSFRLFKLFIGPMIIQQNRIRDALSGKGYSRSQSIPERMGVLLAAWVVPALLFDLIMLRFPEDDEDDGLDRGDWSKWAFTKIAMYPMMTVPFVRDAAAPIEAAILDKPTFARNNPVSDAGATIAKAGIDTTEQVLDAVQEGEEIDGERMFRNWFKAAGVGLGLPTSAATPPGEFIYDVAMKEYEPEGPQDLRYLFVRREDR